MRMSSSLKRPSSRHIQSILRSVASTSEAMEVLFSKDKIPDTGVRRMFVDKDNQPEDFTPEDPRYHLPPTLEFASSWSSLGRSRIERIELLCMEAMSRFSTWNPSTSECSMPTVCWFRHPMMDYYGRKSLSPDLLKMLHLEDESNYGRMCERMDRYLYHACEKEESIRFNPYQPIMDLWSLGLMTLRVNAMSAVIIFD